MTSKKELRKTIRSYEKTIDEVWRIIPSRTQPGPREYLENVVRRALNDAWSAGRAYEQGWSKTISERLDSLTKDYTGVMNEYTNLLVDVMNLRDNLADSPYHVSKPGTPLDIDVQMAIDGAYVAGRRDEREEWPGNDQLTNLKTQVAALQTNLELANDKLHRQMEVERLLHDQREPGETPLDVANHLIKDATAGKVANGTLQDLREYLEDGKMYDGGEAYERILGWLDRDSK